MSGGPDSTALMRLVAALVGGDAAGIVVATVDHGLRPGSAAEAASVAVSAAQCGLRHETIVWQGDKPKTGIQDLARQVRYRLLLEVARRCGAAYLLTAHTLDDQAETLVMRLLRGTGIGGLAGMQAETPLGPAILARPFLGLRKARLVATCRAHDWPYLEDSSNADPRFARSRLRDTLMPALAREGFTAERAGVLARRALRVEAALARRAEEILAQSTISRAGDRLELSGEVLLREPEAVRLETVARAIASVLGPAARPPRLERLERIVLDELSPALDQGRVLQRTLAGVLLATTAARRLRVAPEPPRRSGLTSG